MWYYNDKEIHSHEDLDPLTTDIVYILEYQDGHIYIGKKTVRSIRRLKPTKKQLAIRKNYVRKEMKDHPFMDYEGSSKETEGHIVARKTIVYQCNNKRTATYLEEMLLFQEDALVNPQYLNANIGGRYFDTCLDGLITIKGDENGTTTTDKNEGDNRMGK